MSLGTLMGAVVLTAVLLALLLGPMLALGLLGIELEVRGPRGRMLFRKSFGKTPRSNR